MPISIVCSQCDKKLKAPDGAAGKKIRCPSCKAVIAVPLAGAPGDLNEPDEEISVTAARPPKQNSDLVKNTPPPKKRVDDDEEDPKEFEDDEEDELRINKKKKRFDDDEHDAVRAEPHRAMMILVLGMLSIPICMCPFISWVMGGIAVNMADADLIKMKAGRMDSTGQSMTQTGKMCGIAGVVLGIVFNAIGGFLVYFMNLW